jgi:hypothetical protein
MNRHTYAAAFLAVVVLHLGPATASGAQLTHIHWDVSGGAFSSPGFAMGPITGGALDWTPPGGKITTPASWVTGGTWTLVLTGPSGYFRMGGYPGGGVVTYINPLGATACVGPAPGTTPRSGTSPPGSSIHTLWSASFYYTPGPQGTLNLRGLNHNFLLIDHVFTIGNEVRTYASPQVIPSMTQLGVLLLALGLVATGGSATTRARRRRRV